MLSMDNAVGSGSSSSSSPSATNEAKLPVQDVPVETLSMQFSLQIRKLNEGDFQKDFIPLLEQLSSVGGIDEGFFKAHLASVFAHRDSQLMLVAEDLSLNRVCATGTLVIEPKFIHSAGYVGHLEDLVVDFGLRGKGLGKKIVEKLKAFAKANGCYKVILDCSEENVKFYERCGFKRKECSMVSYFKENELQHFDLRTYAKLPIPPTHMDGLVVRQLSKKDYDKNFLSLLAQLTTVGEVPEEFFKKRMELIERDPFQYIMVIEDPDKGIIGAGTLFIEQKFIHRAGLAGHIEDVVVDSTIRGKGLGKIMVNTLRDLAKTTGCYKVILDCSEKNMGFYEKCGFQRGHSPVCMACYFE